METPAAIAAFLAACRAQEGLPYIWPSRSNGYSGKGTAASACRYPEGRDCSGLVSVALWAAGDREDRRLDWNADRYWRELVRTPLPLPGDLVLYGSPERASHIEVVFPDERTFGAVGGNSDMVTPEQARAAKASVRFRSTPRPDLLGFVRNPLRPSEDA